MPAPLVLLDFKRFTQEKAAMKGFKTQGLWLFSITVLVLGSGIYGCAFMDLQVETMAHPEYGMLAPRVPIPAVGSWGTGSCQYYSPENLPNPATYTVLATFIVQESPTKTSPWSASQMICYMAKEAISKGADAIVVDKIETIPVGRTGHVYRPRVTMIAIRFKGEVPK